MLSCRLGTVVLMASIMGAAIAQKPTTAHAQVSIVDFVVNSVVVEGDQLIANATATLDIAGNLVTQDLEIPIFIGDASCDILNLVVPPVTLDLLGLVVYLHDCDDGPITVDITAVPGALLGDLLCAIAGLLDGGLSLEDILSLEDLLGLLDPDGDLLEVIRGILNQRLEELLGLQDGEQAAVWPSNRGPDHSHGQGHAPGHSHGQGKGPGHTHGRGRSPGHGNGNGNGNGNGEAGRCDILNLTVAPDGIFLDLLGLQVDTSAICLEVYAQQGEGNLLGNLLCNLVGFPGSDNALNNLLGRINELLDSLDLLDPVDL